MKHRPAHPFIIPDGGLALDRPYTHAEWDQAAILGTGDRRSSTLRHTQAHKRLSILFVSIVFLLISLYARVAYLELVAGDKYRARAEGNRLHTQHLLAPRGEIVDRFGTTLVANESRFVLSVLPQEMPRTINEQTAGLVKLAGVTGLDAKDLQTRWQAISSRRVAELVLYESLPRLAALRFYEAANNFPEFRLSAAPRRVFRNSSLALVIGQTAYPDEAELQRQPNLYPTDTIGVAGLEAEYDQALRGTMGLATSEVDNRGRTLAIQSWQAPISGKKLVTTIDNDLQIVATASMQKVLATAGKQRAALVAIDPLSGAIRALVNWPQFDPNALTGEQANETYQQLINDKNRPLFLRAISGLYPPGSTIKPFLAAAGLAENIITPQTTVLSTGGMRVGQWFFPDWRADGHGVTNVTKAIADSVNTFFYLLGGGDPNRNIPGLGVDRMRRYVESFGLNQRLGIDLPGEQSGFFPSPEWKTSVKGEPWYIGDTYHAAIGQGDVLVTPLQMAVATAALANSGKVFRPYLAEGQGMLLRSVLPSEEHLAVVRQAMRAAVVNGSARRLANLAFPVAGKTGTAQGNTKLPHAWFIGFGPYENPTLALAIIVEDAGEGSAVAVPIAHDIFAWYFANRVDKTVDTRDQD